MRINDLKRAFFKNLGIFCKQIHYFHEYTEKCIKTNLFLRTVHGLPLIHDSYRAFCMI